MGTKGQSSHNLADLLNDVTQIISSNAAHGSDILNSPISEDSDFSIAQKHKNSEYQSVAAFLTDFRNVVSSLISSMPMGTEEYVHLDQFYHFNLDLIQREATRLGFLDKQERSAADENSREENDDVEETDFESDVFGNGSRKLFTEVERPYGEAYYILAQHGPLFSSLTGKSSLDVRDSQTAGAFKTTKVISYEGNAPNHQLSFSSPLVSRIPHPAMPPTEIMKNFKHPVDTTMSTGAWLSFGESSSFAPKVEDSKVIFDSETASSVWYEKQGARELQRLLNKNPDGAASLASGASSLPASSPSEEGADEMDVDDETAKSGREGTAEPADGTAAEEAGEGNDAEENVLVKSEGDKSESQTDTKLNGIASPSDVDIVRVVEWTPGSFIDDDEIEAAEHGTEIELISLMLLELQQLQRIRLINQNGDEYLVSPEERRLSFKINNLLTRVLSEVSPKDLDLKTSPYLPVLAANYCGTLPVPDPKMQRPLANQSRIGSKYNTSKNRR